MDKIIYIADDDNNIRNLLKSFLEALPSDLLATLGCREVWVM